MSRVVVTLHQDERTALVKLALAELRDPRSQARHIIRCELERCGLLETAEQQAQAQAQGGGSDDG